MNKNEKKNRTPVTININTLVGNLIVVTRNENETSETISQELEKILLKILNSAQAV